MSAWRTLPKRPSRHNRVDCDIYASLWNAQLHKALTVDARFQWLIALWTCPFLGPVPFPFCPLSLFRVLSRAARLLLV